MEKLHNLTVIFAMLIYKRLQEPPHSQGYFDLSATEVNFSDTGIRHAPRALYESYNKQKNEYVHLLKKPVLYELQDKLGLNCNVEETKHTHRNNAWRTVQDNDWDLLRTTIRIPFENNEFIGKFNEYIDAFKDNKLTGVDITNFSIQQKNIEKIIQEKIDERGNNYAAFNMFEIEKLNKEHRVCILEYLQFEVRFGSCVIDKFSINGDNSFSLEGKAEDIEIHIHSTFPRKINTSNYFLQSIFA